MLFTPFLPLWCSSVLPPKSRQNTTNILPNTPQTSPKNTPKHPPKRPQTTPKKQIKNICSSYF